MSYTFGALFAVGGAIGYLKAKSFPSLIAGLGLGSLMVVSGIVIGKGRDFEGHSLALATSILATGGMGSRAVRTGKLVPAGIVALAAGVSAAYHGKKAYEWS